MTGHSEAGPDEPVEPFETVGPSDTADAVVRWRDVFRSRARLTFGLIVLETVTAVQLLIVITILPVVVRDLGGLRLYGWAISASSLAAMIALPVTGRAADRRGPAAALTIVLGIFVAGTIIAALAPSMPVLIVGRFLQGWGLGAQYAVALGAVAKTYPEAHRPRIVALLTAAWVIPGVVGPTVGALIASTIGWRWTFLVSLPFVILAAVMVLPELRGLPPSPSAEREVGLRWIVQLAAGAAAVLLAVTALAWWSVPVGVAGAAMLIPALREILPKGSLSAQPGLPAAVAAAFLLSFVYFCVDGFVPLLLQRVRGQTVAVAGIVVTLSTLAWAGGTWWQSRQANVRSPAWLATLATIFLLTGVGGVWLGVLPAVPLVVIYVAWTIGGIGMGIGFPVIPLVAMDVAGPAGTTSVVASAALTDMLGASIGPGLGGAAIAIAASLGATLSAGLAGAFALALAVGLLLLPVSSRLPGQALT